MGIGLKVAFRDRQSAKRFRAFAPKYADISVSEVVRYLELVASQPESALNDWRPIALALAYPSPKLCRWFTPK